MNMLRLLTIPIIVFFSLLPTSALSETGYNNDRALAGLSQVKIYFDVTHQDAEIVLLRMDLASRTISQFEESGIGVNAVIGFRGGASRYITSGEHYVLDEDIDTKLKIGAWVERFAKNNIVIEQCAIAADLQGIAAADFLPDVTLVKNGYISLVGYQAQGYSVVPMD